jgi:hypothetical protein
VRHTAKVIKHTYDTIGIIPAAGKASRFGGILKEMLPAHDGVSLISHAYKRLKRHCDLIVVVTNTDKVQHHMTALKGVAFVEQQKQTDLIGAVQAAMEIRAKRYLFTMPDTYASETAFDNMPQSFLSLGLFLTHKPERFGCLVDKAIYDKQATTPSPAMAWGALSWECSARDIWLNAPTLTDGLNNIIAQHGYSTWDIGDYYDMASMRDYADYIQTCGAKLTATIS